MLSDRHFHDEAAAYRFVETSIWPNGAVCPHCGGTDRNSETKGNSARIGTYKCYDCPKPFTVKIGTIFEASHVKLHLWLQAIFPMTSSKKGISRNPLHRTLGVTLETAWFMSHRIREAMREGNLGPLGGKGKIVEADDAYYGKATEKPYGHWRSSKYHPKPSGKETKRLGQKEQCGRFEEAARELGAAENRT